MLVRFCGAGVSQGSMSPKQGALYELGARQRVLLSRRSSL